MSTHSFKAGDAVAFNDRFASGRGTVKDIKTTTKGDFIVITTEAGGERSVRPASVIAA